MADVKRFRKKSRSRLVLAVIAVGAALITALIFTIPYFLSSAFARNIIESRLAERLQKQVSIGELSFSWNEGFALSGLTICNKDQSPFLNLRELKLTLSLPKLMIGKITFPILIIRSLEAIIVRDKSGETNIWKDLGATREKRSSSRQHGAFPVRFLRAFSPNIQLKDVSVIIIDERLERTTRLKQWNVSLSVYAYPRPITVSASGNIAINEQPPEPIALHCSVGFAPEGNLDILRARGGLELQATFGQAHASFDLAKFNNPRNEGNGGEVSCFLDLGRLTEMAAGIIGCPPGFSLQGQLRGNLRARGSFLTGITLKGETQVDGFAVAGGLFHDTSFAQPCIRFFQDLVLNIGTNVIGIKALEIKSNLLNLALAGTVSNIRNTPFFNLRLRGSGNVDDSIPLLRTLMPLPSDVNITGLMEFALSGTGTLSRLMVRGKTTIKDFQIDSPSLNGYPYREALIEVTPEMLINIPKKSITASCLTVATEALNAEAKGTIDNNDALYLDVRCIARFAALRKQLRGIIPQSFPHQGQSVSELTIKGDVKKSVTITGEHSIKNVTVTMPVFSGKQSSSTPRSFSIPQITVTQDLVYRVGEDLLRLTELKADTPFSTLEASGDLTQVSRNPFTTFQGKLSLDLPKTQTLLREIFPKKLGIRGKGYLTVVGQGSIRPPGHKTAISSWKASGSLSAETIAYQGIGIIQNLRSTGLSLEKGILHSNLECLLNQGPFHSEITVDFNGGEPDAKLTLEGKTLRFSQDTKLFGYILPILILSPSEQVTGTMDFFTQAAWRGAHWSSEVVNTITGHGKLTLSRCALQSDDVLSNLLRTWGKSGILVFDQIMTNFRLADGKLYNDEILAKGQDLQVSLAGWSSLSYDPKENGNPMAYTGTASFLMKSLGKDAQHFLSFLSGGATAVPITIVGTVQKPRVSVKLPKVKQLFRGLFSPQKSGGEIN